MGEQGGTDERGVTNEGVTNEARKRRGKVLDGEQQIFKRRLRLALGGRLVAHKYIRVI